MNYSKPHVVLKVHKKSTKTHSTGHSAAALVATTHLQTWPLIISVLISITNSQPQLALPPNPCHSLIQASTVTGLLLKLVSDYHTQRHTHMRKF